MCNSSSNALVTLALREPEGKRIKESKSFHRSFISKKNGETDVSLITLQLHWVYDNSSLSPARRSATSSLLALFPISRKDPLGFNGEP